ncbi:Serine/threonine kinases,protein kinases,ATP binding,sugar binding,kinases,carbohydrate binding, putative [Theobroma cacao]|uniref:Receptor-like serine/threonine-protein kinase n=1 Tax=Theobroma cacao TaxID=3641 RepID=A0A061F7S0_THECC|nr:Serine/threonine kinases,protein kinases,ATP binding,sugar binding,kinases,carbohydrate binding, putative [Theobroma cacao]
MEETLRQGEGFISSDLLLRIKGFTILLLCFFFCPNLVITSTEFDTIDTTRSIKDGETIVSAGGVFEVGFFSPSVTNKRYLGIWYKKSNTTVVWVANREVPLNDSSGVLKVTNQGILILLDNNGSTVWSSNSSTSARTPVAQILDSGNLVVKDETDGNPQNFMWQSFDYPCDTFLPNMKIGKDLVTGLDRYLSSWKETNDPFRGNFTYGFDLDGFPEWVLREGSIKRMRRGPWNGLRFSGVTGLTPNSVYGFEFVFNEKEIYFSWNLYNSSSLSRVLLLPNGNIQRFTWIDEAQNWVLHLPPYLDTCDSYALCGVNGNCNNNNDNSPACNCLKGFEPKIKEEWEVVPGLGGCVRKTPLNCKDDGFLKYTGLKLPDASESWFNYSMNLEECKNHCIKNCNCTAYTNLDVRGEGSGCLIWFNDLIDIRQVTENDQAIYIRMAAAELDQIDSKKTKAESNAKKIRVIIGVSIALPTTILILGLVLFFWRKKHHERGFFKCICRSSSNNENQREDPEVPLFDMATLVHATKNFSIKNKLGEGGFGSVFKGMLKDGREIAVKRLSENSRQGLSEFKNEVVHIAKLQHRNLVKLLGCCVEGDEKMLIYEFMPNKSLNFFLFDQAQSLSLDWPKRYNIINGIARGLLYLHQDSRQRIIHRDLKTGNILLDSQLNPKISDFGLARSFGENVTKEKTKNVVGTYGYMSPEYAIDGLYSIKSDVFSFGVLVLEIVSGKRNRGFSHPDHHHNLLGHAWKLYAEGKPLQLIAAPIRDTCNLSEVLRSIHIGLLCVQRNPEDRPRMSTVVLMLGGESPLPQPKQPGFFNERDLSEAKSSSSNQKPCSYDELTITLMEGR